MNRHTLIFSYDGFMSAAILAQGAVHLSCFVQRESHPSHPSTYISLMFDGVSSIAAQVLSTRAVHRAAGPEGKGLANEIEASLNDDFEVDLALAAEERFLTATSKGDRSRRYIAEREGWSYRRCIVGSEEQARVQQR
jgi:hypothetical protein